MNRSGPPEAFDCMSHVVSTYGVAVGTDVSPVVACAAVDALVRGGLDRELHARTKRRTISLALTKNLEKLNTIPNSQSASLRARDAVVSVEGTES